MFSALIRKTRSRQFYVDSANGSNSKSGRSPHTAFATIAKAVSKARSRDVIHLYGEFAEAVIIPLAKEYLTFIGEGPYQRSAQWMESAVGQTLVTVNSKGCRFENIYFRCPQTAGISILLKGDGTNDARYTEIVNCKFQGRTGSYYHVKTEKGCDNVHIDNCVFTFHNTATHGTAIFGEADGSKTPGGWIIENCIFLNGLRHIYMTGRSIVVRNNIFQGIGIDSDGGSLTATSVIDLNVNANGVYNVLFGNQFGGDYAQSVYNPGTNDNWSGNFSEDEAEAEVGDNGLTVSPPA